MGKIQQYVTLTLEAKSKCATIVSCHASTCIAQYKKATVIMYKIFMIMYCPAVTGLYILKDL